MPTYYGNRRGGTGVPNTKALNTVRTFKAVGEWTADQQFAISGVTKDSTGAALGNVEVELYHSLTDIVRARTVSDATTGYYIFYVKELDTHYAVAYKAGAPDVAGTTVNTLTGV